MIIKSLRGTKNSYSRDQPTDLASRMAVIEADHASFQKWSYEVSATINDLQLRKVGLSPLQNHFGDVLAPRYKDE